MSQPPRGLVLYADGGRAAPPAIVALALRLFGHTLDLTRDLALGDRVRLVVSDDTAGRATLDYAELDGARGPVRLYRVGPPGSGDAAYVDETGADLRRLLLRTPLAHPRLTSGFGFRLHPLLGYSRLHAGLDFGAAVGTPVLAAADGVVTRAGWAAGYGRLIVIAHCGGLETRYAHLSALSPGISPGARVAQGSAIGLSGQSGLATGPHLHFEVRRDGQPLDPATAVTLPAPAPTAAQTIALAERRREVEAVLGGDERPEPP